MRGFYSRGSALQFAAQKCVSALLPVVESLESRKLLAAVLTNLATFQDTSVSSLVQANGFLYGTAGGEGLSAGTIFSMPVVGGEPKTIATFNGTDGELATTLIVANGKLYGTTSMGGKFGCGTVFSVPLGGGTPTVLANFTEEGGPNALILSGNTLYGTTTEGGKYAAGTAFSLPVTGGTLKLLATFGGTNPALPSGLTIFGNTLYGTTAQSYGNVYSLATTGGPIKVIATFNGIDGQTPSGTPLVYNGNLFGCTQAGGLEEGGVVYSVPLSGGVPKVLVSFSSNNTSGGGDGLLLSGSTLFGYTTQQAIIGDLNFGTVFSLPLSGGSSKTLVNLPVYFESFYSPLIYDNSGALYGEIYDLLKNSIIVYKLSGSGFVVPATTNVSIAASTPAASEAGVNGSFTVTRTGSTASSLTVAYKVSGTARSGTDYTALTGTVTIPAGKSSATITVVPKGNIELTTSATVVVTLKPSSAYSIPSTPTATANISSALAVITSATNPGTVYSTLTLNGHFASSKSFVIRLSDGKGYTINLNTISSSTTSLQAVIPVYFVAATGQLLSGTLTASAVPVGGGTGSNAFSGIVVQNLPTLKATPGSVTLAYLNAELSFASQIESQSSGKWFDTQAYAASLQEQTAAIQSQITAVSSLMSGKSQSYILGTFNSSPIGLTKSGLGTSDRVLTAELFAESVATSASPNTSLGGEFAAAAVSNSSSLQADANSYVKTVQSATQVQSATADKLKWVDGGMTFAAAATAVAGAEPAAAAIAGTQIGIDVAFASTEIFAGAALTVQGMYLKEGGASVDAPLAASEAMMAEGAKDISLAFIKPFSALLNFADKMLDSSELTDEPPTDPFIGTWTGQYSGNINVFDQFDEVTGEQIAFPAAGTVTITISQNSNGDYEGNFTITGLGSVKKSETAADGKIDSYDIVMDNTISGSVDGVSGGVLSLDAFLTGEESNVDEGQSFGPGPIGFDAGFTLTPLNGKLNFAVPSGEGNGSGLLTRSS